MGAIEQSVIKGLIEVFVKQYTLPINTPLSKHIVNFMKKNRKDYDTSEEFMDDFDFIEDDDLDINAMFDNQDDIPLDDEFIRTHFNTIPDGETIQNFPF